MNKSNLQSRRGFIRQAACAALGTSGMLSSLWDLRRINAATATASGDYKALVCLYLYGGNDGNNMLVPSDTSTYGAYSSARETLAIPRTGLLPITPRTTDGRSYGLHGSMPEIQALFQAGRLAIVPNVGTLVEPITRTQFMNGSVPVPPELFSHRDQQVQWQTCIPQYASNTGWGGRAADLLMSLNTAPNLSTAVSLGGINTFEVGNTVVPYGIAPTGVVGLQGYDHTPEDNTRYAAMQSILALQPRNLFEQEFAKSTRLAIQDNALLVKALSLAPVLQTIFPNSTLAAQLHMVARLISARAALGMHRQVFFCAITGFDTHGEQMISQAGLLAELSQGMSAFYKATVELGVDSQVTTFTASDFGRTLSTNNAGTDHGWGNHHMVMGSAVAGRNLYGTFPTLAVNGPDDTGLGRWIPTTSVDEYSATLATWFGVSKTDLPIVLPNIGRFAKPNLGFMLS